MGLIGCYLYPALKGGTTYGNTDEFGYRAEENVVHHYDYLATVLHLFGLEHQQVAFARPNGIGSLLDGQPANVVWNILKRGPREQAVA